MAVRSFKEHLKDQRGRARGCCAEGDEMVDSQVAATLLSSIRVSGDQLMMSIHLFHRAARRHRKHSGAVSAANEVVRLSHAVEGVKPTGV